jgi:excisionase family DNA binding protein
MDTNMRGKESMSEGMQEDEKLFTFKEAMIYLCVSRNTVYRFMHEKGLIGHKVGIQWRFYLADLRSFVKGRQVVEEVEGTEDTVEQS